MALTGKLIFLSEMRFCNNIKTITEILQGIDTYELEEEEERVMGKPGSKLMFFLKTSASDNYGC